MGARIAGWYADPVTVGAARYWDGRAWTQQVAWGGQVRTDPTPLAEVARRDAAARGAVVADYLAGAERRHVVGTAAFDALWRDLEERTPAKPARPLPPRAAPASTRTPTPTVAVPASPRLPTPPASSIPSPAAPRTEVSSHPTRPSDAPTLVTPPAPAAAPAASAATPTLRSPVAAIPSEPGRLGRWWDDLRRAVRSDLALHGLAYLGVLLLFAGVTGLIIFSFGDVSPWLRPLAEVLVPTALFVSAWYLYRRRAVVVAASLTFLGGAITPIVVAASLTDGSEFPPDLSGHALPIVQGIAVALVGVAYAVVARRHPANPLRHLAAPVLWMAAGIAAGVWRDPVPAGYATVRADSLQLAVVLAAIAASVAACTWRVVPRSLADTTERTALPVAAVVVVLELILAGSAGWPLAGTIVAGLAVLALSELLADRLTPAGASIAQVAVVAISAGRLAAVVAPAWVAGGAAVALLGLVELQGRRRPTIAGTAVGLGAASAAFLLVLVEPAPTAVAYVVLTAWGLWRHVVPPEWLPVRDRAGFVPAVAATVATVALWDLGERGPALVGTAATVLAVALVARRWRPDDLLWRWFVPASAAAVVVVSMTFPWAEMPLEVAAAAALVTVAFVLCSLPTALRTWLAAGAIVWGLANLAVDLGVSRAVQAISLGLVALLIVVGAVLTRRPIGVHLAAIGHVAGVGALAVAPWPGWVAAVVLAMATMAWLVVTAVDEHGEAVHLAALRRVLALGTIDAGSADPDGGDVVPDAVYGAGDAIPVVEQLPPLITFGGIVGTVVLGLDASARLAADDPWMAAIVAGLAALAAGVVRLVPWHRARPGVLAWTALLVATSAGVAVAAEVGSDRGHWAPIVAFASVLVAIAVTASPRPLPFVWIGWAVGAVLALFVTDRLGLDRDWTDVAAAAWGAAALLGGLALYRRRHGPVVSLPVASEPLLLPPVALGALAFVVGGVLGVADGSDLEIGWTSTGLAVVVLLVAAVIPLGGLIGLAEVLGTVAYALLAPWEPLDRPWTFAPWAVVLLAVALVARDADSRRWDVRRWDLPSFLVAHGIALAALATAVSTDTVASTYGLFGAVSMTVACTLRRWQWAVAGALLVLVAAFDAGHGWPALTLLAVGVTLTVVGLRRQERELRWILLGLGATAVVGAWFDLVEWLQWSNATIFLATMPSAAALALLAAVALRTRRLPMDLATVWTIAGSGLAIGVAGLVDAADRRAGGLTMAGSWILLAAVAAVSAAVVSGALRWIAVGFVASAWLSVRWAWEPSGLVVVLVSTGVALASLATLAALHHRRPDAVWLLPAAGHAVLVQSGGAVAAAAELPETGLTTIVLSAIGVELTVLGLLHAAERRWVLLGLGAASWAGAWFTATVWLGWSGDTVFVVTAPAAALLALLAAVLLRTQRVPVELAAVHLVAGTLVAIGTSTMVASVDRLPGGLATAAASLLLATASATLAPVLSGRLRWATAALAVGASVSLQWALQPTTAVTTLVGTGVALVVLVAALALQGRRPDELWLVPVVAFAAAIQVGAASAALVALPETAWLVVVLLAVGAELVAAGVIVGRPALFVLAPASACAAWLVYAQDALRGNANWFTVPIGLTVLVMVGLLRWIRSWRGGEVTSWDVVALELAGMGFLVASPLALTLDGQLWNGVVAIVLGVLVAVWGVMTRVRWRAGFGAGTVVLAVVLLIGVPLSDAVTWRGPTLWIVLSLVGIAAIVAASAIESSRDRLRQLAHRLDEMTTGWERLPIHRDGPGDDHTTLPPPSVASGIGGATS